MNEGLGELRVSQTLFYFPSDFRIAQSFQIFGNRRLRFLYFADLIWNTRFRCSFQILPLFCEFIVDLYFAFYSQILHQIFFYETPLEHSPELKLRGSYCLI